MMSDYTGLDDDDELSRFRAHEADELDATLDRESEDGRANEAAATFWRWYAGCVVLVAIGSIAFMFWDLTMTLTGSPR